MRPVLAFLVLASPVFAQDRWVGQKFMPREGARFSRGTYQVPEFEIDRPFLVQRELPGDLLDIGSIYVAKSKVVPLAEAAVYYDDYLRSHPGSGWAYANRAHVAGAFHRWDQALEYYAAAIQLDPKNPWFYVDRAQIWRAKEKLGDALNDLNKASRLHRSAAPIFINRGEVLLALGEYEAALDDFNALLRFLPQNSRSLAGRGHVWYAQGDLQAALRDYDNALRADPKNSLALASRAWLLATAPDAKIRDGKRAMQDAELAADLTNFSHAGVLDALAATHAELGDFSQAIQWQENALVLDPTRADLKERLDLYRNKSPFHGVLKPTLPEITSGSAL